MNKQDEFLLINVDTRYMRLINDKSMCFPIERPDFDYSLICKDENGIIKFAFISNSLPNIFEKGLQTFIPTKTYHLFIYKNNFMQLNFTSIFNERDILNETVLKIAGVSQEDIHEIKKIVTEYCLGEI